MNIAIVTGASSGIGKEFVRQISLAYGDELDEIWVIARRTERLKEISQLVSTPISVMSIDLTNKSDLIILEEALKVGSPNVRMLVNAAGFGKMGRYDQISRQDASDMIKLNCEALVEVTNMVLPYMCRCSNIIQVCSSSAFQPLPGINVYAATKAFVLSYSRGLRWELFPKDINVTAVCPYWVKDTEFISTSKVNADSCAVKSFPFAMEKRKVVRDALLDTELGLAVSTPGVIASIQRISSKIMPKCATIALWEIIRRI